jgi:hypothetical protein
MKINSFDYINDNNSSNEFKIENRIVRTPINDLNEFYIE